MAGQPFDTALLRAIRDAAVFTPVITLAAMRRLGEVTAASVDFSLLECITALHFRQTRTIAIFPILVGADVAQPPGASRASARWDLLPDNAEFRRLRAALPAVVPQRCLDTALVTLRAVEGADAELAPGLATATVRDIVDCAQGELRGLLQFDWFVLEGRQETVKMQVADFAARAAQMRHLPE